jgi:hypothetical protein
MLVTSGAARAVDEFVIAEILFGDMCLADGITRRDDLNDAGAAPYFTKCL